MDLIYCLLEGQGKTTFKATNLVREAGDITEDQINTLLSKSNRLDRAKPLNDWLPNYIQGNLIAKATYAIRWEHFKLAKLLSSTTENPNKVAWERYAPKSIETIEFVMDIRKGGFSKQQINTKLEQINSISLQILNAQKDGDWFAKSVTSGVIQDIDNFVVSFPTLDTYANYVFNQLPK